jgi:hypothetical protein
MNAPRGIPQTPRRTCTYVGQVVNTFAASKPNLFPCLPIIHNEIVHDEGTTTDLNESESVNKGEGIVPSVDEETLEVSAVNYKPGVLSPILTEYEEEVKEA